MISTPEIIQNTIALLRSLYPVISSVITSIQTVSYSYCVTVQSWLPKNDSIQFPYTYLLIILHSTQSIFHFCIKNGCFHPSSSTFAARFRKNVFCSPFHAARYVICYIGTCILVMILSIRHIIMITVPNTSINHHQSAENIPHWQHVNTFDTAAFSGLKSNVISSLQPIK